MGGTQSDTRWGVGTAMGVGDTSGILILFTTKARLSFACHGDLGAGIAQWLVSCLLVYCMYQPRVKQTFNSKHWNRLGERAWLLLANQKRPRG